MMIMKYLYGAIGVSVVTMIVGGYLYYKDTQARLRAYAENQAVLELNLQRSENTITQIRQNIRNQIEQNKILNQELQKAEQEKNSLTEKLSKHNLQYLAKRKPGLIEKRINDATRKVFDDIERVTNSR